MCETEKNVAPYMRNLKERVQRVRPADIFLPNGVPTNSHTKILIDVGFSNPIQAAYIYEAASVKGIAAKKVEDGNIRNMTNIWKAKTWISSSLQLSPLAVGDSNAQSSSRLLLAKLLTTVKTAFLSLLPTSGSPLLSCFKKPTRRQYMIVPLSMIFLTLITSRQFLRRLVCKFSILYSVFTRCIPRLLILY